MQTPAQKQVDKIKAKFLSMPQVECPLNHHFTPGLYYRELFVPKGTLFVTKIHQTTHPYVIAQGRISVWTEQSGVVRIIAPYHAVTTPGTRRIVYTHTDCVWFTFHPTNETNIEKLEEFLFYEAVKDDIDVSIVTELKEDKQ